VFWLDNSAERYRAAVGYVGEDGIKPMTWYEADGVGGLREVRDGVD
jgi:hypothetical protein